VTGGTGGITCGTSLHGDGGDCGSRARGEAFNGHGRMHYRCEAKSKGAIHIISLRKAGRCAGGLTGRELST
jgi:hypothetical protein